MNSKFLLGSLVFSMGLLGCAKQDNLTFTTFTKLGVDVSATDGVPTSAMMGYKRFEGAIIPVEPDQSTGDASDVHSVFASIDLENKWLTGLNVRQTFATGEAAVNVASRPEGLSAAFGEKTEGGNP